MVEDEPVINDAVADRLRAEGFHVDQAYDGPAAVARCAEVDPELVVLDVMLPGFDGHEVCRRIQATRPVPVLMLTARDDEADVLVGLAVGADDYLTKPFRMRELVARVRALLRRVDRAAELAARPSARLVVGDLVVDTGARRVTVAEEEVRLTPTEFDLLTRLATTPGEVLTREHLLAEVLGLAGRVRDPHRRQPRACAARQGRPRPGAHRPWGRLRAGGPGGAAGGATGRRRVSSPLQPLTSIKVKLGLLVTASALVAALVGALASSAAVPMLLAVPVTVALALAVTQLLAVGMTSPLREMTEATRRMARGDYRGRVRADSSDEIGELARAFNQMAAELATVDSEQRNLVATVSHELRTPLAALTATLENLADGVRPADAEHLGRAVDQAQRIGALVGDLLELSRVEAGVAPLRLGPVRVGALVDEVVADLVPTGRAVRFDVDVPESLEVQADPTRLRQLLTNVLDNAVRHSPEGGRVRVTLRGHGRAVACWTSPTRGRGSRPPTGSARSSGSARWPTPPRARRPAGPGWASPSRAGWRPSTAAPSGSPIRRPVRPARSSASTCPSARPHVRPPRPTRRPRVPTMPTQPTPPGPPPPPPPIHPGHPGSAVVPAPVLDPLFGRFWPDVPGGSRALVLAAAGVGVLAGLVLPEPLRRPGPVPRGRDGRAHGRRTPHDTSATRSP